jgi:antitoxin (DNA-binding transcriptional repressor) of toxin-antitoxin stability system
MTTTIEVSELPNRLSEAISVATSGGEAVVTLKQVPIARLVPVNAGKDRVPGLHPGAITMADDFDAPLPDEFWTGSPGRVCSTRTRLSGGIAIPPGCQAKTETPRS